MRVIMPASILAGVVVAAARTPLDWSGGLAIASLGPLMLGILRGIKADGRR